MLSDRYKPFNIPEKFNRPIQTKAFPQAYENYYLSFYDIDLVKDLIDYWGLLYVQPKKDSELKYVEHFRDKKFDNDDHRQNAIKKATRQEARQPFFDELTTRTVKDMTENVRRIAELLVMTSYAQLVI